MTAHAATILRPKFRVLGPGMVVVACALALTFLGLVELSSAGRGANIDPQFFFKRQCVWLVLAIAAGIGATVVDLEWLRKHTWIFGATAVTLLALVLVPHVGVTVNGARRWLDLGVMRAQPSDMGKLALVFCLARYLADNQRNIRTFWRGFVAPMCIIGVFAALIIREPDFGTTALCGMVGFALLYLAGVRLFYLFPTMFAGGALFSLAVYFDPVRMRRILSFLDMQGNKSDGSYQLWQGILGFGSGGLWGVGLGEGRQPLSFLPEAHTDFVLAVVGEELGLFATAGVAVLFLILFITGVRALSRAPNLYEFTLAAGALLLLTGQAIVNMGVVTGLLPTKGMSLPFISYGGSNLVLMFTLIGILMNCFRRWQRPPLPRAREL